MNLRRRFLPAASEHRTRRRITLLLLAGGGLFVALIALPPAWEYTNSPSFCGTTCHTMPPEYTTYLVSPHARVPCVDCHIGRDLIAVQAFRKSAHLRFIAATVLDEFELPVRAGALSPARETCERCHFPEKFSHDSLRVINRYETDRDNTPYDIYLLMHTGGGSEREGLSRGIHWHVENEVSYIALDEREQEIPWVRVERADGQVEEYNAINSPIDVEHLDQYEMAEMDCITCHNRISHSIKNPGEAVEAALARGDLPDDIPFIRTRAAELLSVRYASQDAARRAFGSLEPYYRENYPEFYAEGVEQIDDAIELLERLYDESNFPEQRLSWDTHPDNIGHRDSPGCFRCHDGQHFNEAGEVIRLECNLCHSIPLVVGPEDIEPLIPVTTGLEPSNHLRSTWITEHRDVFDVTCANCHTTGNPGGTDNSSFCSNSVCHGVEWRYAGFDAPGLAAMLGVLQARAEPLLQDFAGDPTYAILQPLFAQECGACHGATPSRGLRLTDYAALLSGGEGGPVVAPGSPDESALIEVLTDGHFARLTNHQMDLLTRWVANGAPES